MKTVNLIFPHHLFEKSPLFQENKTFYLVEEYLYFKQYKFHKQKIAFHRTSMKRYEAFLREKGFDVVYINAYEEMADIRTLLPKLVSSGVQQVNYIDPVDNWLQKRIVTKFNENK